MTTYEPIKGTEPSADSTHEPRTLVTQRNGMTHMLTEIGDGTFVGWDTCGRCSRPVTACRCAQGPVEPAHIERWRDERFAGSFKARGVLPKPDLKPVLAAAQAAQDAALGDSNDEEIDLLRGALDQALHALGLTLPEGVEPGDEEDEHPEHTECADGCGLAVTHQGACLDKPGGRRVCEHNEVRGEDGRLHYEGDGCPGLGHEWTSNPNDPTDMYLACGADFMAGTICSLSAGHEGGGHGTECHWCGGDWYEGSCTCVDAGDEDGEGDPVVYHPLPNGAGLAPLAGDQPNETGNVPIGQTEEETPEPETATKVSLKEDVGAGLTAALEQLRSAKRGPTDAES